MYSDKLFAHTNTSIYGTTELCSRDPSGMRKNISICMCSHTVHTHICTQAPRLASLLQQYQKSTCICCKCMLINFSHTYPCAYIFLTPQFCS